MSKKTKEKRRANRRAKKLCNKYSKYETGKDKRIADRMSYLDKKSI